MRKWTSIGMRAKTLLTELTKRQISFHNSWEILLCREYMDIKSQRHANDPIDSCRIDVIPSLMLSGSESNVRIFKENENLSPKIGTD